MKSSNHPASSLAVIAIPTREIKKPSQKVISYMYIYKGKAYILVTATSSGILKAKQKLGRTFNSDKLGGIAFTKISKLTMCSA